MTQSGATLSGQIQFVAADGQRLRVFPRARVLGEVIVHDDAMLHIAKLRDLSAGGLFVEELVTVIPGKQIRLVIRSPKLQKAVQAVGKVVRIETETNRGCAIEFTSISSRSREIIQNCVFEHQMEKVLKVA